MSEGQLCPQCMFHLLDHFGHRALSCKNGPDVVYHHKRICAIIFQFRQRVHSSELGL